MKVYELIIYILTILSWLRYYSYFKKRKFEMDGDSFEDINIIGSTAILTLLTIIKLFLMINWDFLFYKII